MQITDLLNQYGRNIANGTETPAKTTGIRQLMSSVGELSAGNVFEGSVNHIENGVVTLGLSDGQTIMARLDSGVKLNVGQSMFFQVKSNSGGQIAIRPFSNENGTPLNPTLMQALKAANLQPNARMLTMVNTMMEQSMPIDRQSLLSMAKLAAGNGEMNIASIVQMVKLGIPVTEEMAAQFENYKSDRYAVSDQLERFMEQAAEQLTRKQTGEKEFFELNQKLLEVFTNENTEQMFDKTDLSAEELTEQLQTAENANKAAGENPTQQAPTAESTVEALTEQLQTAGKAAEQLQTAGKAAEQLQTTENINKTTAETLTEQTPTAESTAESAAKQPQNAVFKEADLAAFKNLFGEDAVKNLTQKKALQLLSDAFSNGDFPKKEELKEFASSKAYRTLLKNVMENEWLLRPEDLKTEHKIRESYEKLDRQMSRIEQAMQQIGQNTSSLSDTASAIRSNIQFMNQMNQAYTFLQIPLKLTGQNAQSDLYVYTDKKKMREKDAELTAFLHLDLEHLGSTDVSVKMKNRKVSTNFYLADDASYRLISEHMEELKERLEKKGYDAKIQIINQEEKVNFVEELLKQGQSSAGGTVHRYSFDVRA